MRQTPMERREKCNPTLIGVFVGVVSPLSSLIWGIRQRSWSLSIAPFLLVFLIGFITLIETGEEKLKPGVKYPLQLISGFISYEITKSMKEKAIKNKLNTLEIEKE